MVKLAPSILAADLSRLGEELRRTVEAGADWIHLDIMDGHFVPNISFGPQMVRFVDSRTDLFLDSHLMISNPEKYLEIYAEAGSDLITVHYEAEADIDALLNRIRRLERRAGLSLNPNTPLDAVLPHLERCDLLLIMAVHPGFAGQKFMREVLPKIAQARQYIDRHKLDLLLEVDGGISLQTAPPVIEAGADVVVAGSAFYRSEDYAEFTRRIKALPRSAC